MSLSDDIEDDMDDMDETETVTYQRRTLDGTSSSDTTCTALKRASMLDLVGLAQGAQSTKLSARWHIKASTIAVTPRKGDRIVSTVSGTWEVLSVKLECFSTRFACETVKIS